MCRNVKISRSESTYSQVEPNSISRNSNLKVDMRMIQLQTMIIYSYRKQCMQVVTETQTKWLVSLSIKYCESCPMLECVGQTSTSRLLMYGLHSHTVTKSAILGRFSLKNFRWGPHCTLLVLQVLRNTTAKEVFKFKHFEGSLTEHFF